jgi:hypothetical protein
MVVRKATENSRPPGNDTVLEQVDLYTWSGHGNLGDDWIAEVSRKLFPNGKAVREKISFNPLRLGQRELVGGHPSESKSPRVLWGGGWLASDQSNFNTVGRWCRHVNVAKSTGRRVVGFGLGIGPFVHHLADAQSLMHLLKGNLWVRSKSDLDHHFGELVLSADCVFLDDRDWAMEADKAIVEWDYLIDFAPYNKHWSISKPWLTEAFYKESVTRIVSNLQNKSRVAFVEAVRGDADYWIALGLPVVRPSTVSELISAVSSAESVISGRLHLGLMAAFLDKKILAFAYHHKFACLSELGIPVIGQSHEITEDELQLRPQLAQASNLILVRKRVKDQFRVLAGRLS